MNPITLERLQIAIAELVNDEHFPELPEEIQDNAKALYEYCDGELQP